MYYSRIYIRKPQASSYTTYYLSLWKETCETEIFFIYTVKKNLVDNYSTGTGNFYA